METDQSQLEKKKRYPPFYFSTLFGGIVFAGFFIMVSIIIPKFREMFQKMERNLPEITNFFFNIPDYIWWILSILSFVGTCLFFNLIRDKENLESLLDKVHKGMFWTFLIFLGTLIYILFKPLMGLLESVGPR